MVKKPPSTAGDAVLTPSQRTKIPHAAGQLSVHAITKSQINKIFFFKGQSFCDSFPPKGKLFLP